MNSTNQQRPKSRRTIVKENYNCGVVLGVEVWGGSKTTIRAEEEEGCRERLKGGNLTPCDFSLCLPPLRPLYLYTQPLPAPHPAPLPLRFLFVHHWVCPF